MQNKNKTLKCHKNGLSVFANSSIFLIQVGKKPESLAQNMDSDMTQIYIKCVSAVFTFSLIYVQ